MTDDIDAPVDGEDAAAPRVSGRPTGRRARSNFADGLIEVTSADSSDSRPITLPSSSDAEAPVETTADTSAEKTADAPTDASEATPVWTGPSFGFASLGFDGSSIPPLADDSDEPGSEPEPLDEILAAPALEDSSVPRAFPFAAQVEATSDEEGHQSFTLDEFTPEEAARAEAETRAAEDAVEPAPVEEPHRTDEPVLIDEPAPADEAVAEPVVVETAAETAAETVVAEPAPAEPDESTMTRREWRAWRARKEAEAEAAAASGDSAPAETGAEKPGAEKTSAEKPAVENPVFQAPVVAASTSEAEIPQLVEPGEAPATALSDAMAEFEALTRGNSGSIDIPAAQSTTDAPAEAAPVTPVVPAVFTVPEFSVPTSIPVPQKAEPEAAADVAPELPQEPATPEVPPVAEATPPRTPFESLFSVPAEPAAADSAPVEPEAETTGGTPRVSESSADSAYVPPVGHWSRQAALDDESQPFENTLSRDVGGGNVATTTNALVLPMIPQRDDFSSMINSTGEIMVTGTIDLPMSVGATGRDSRHYDDPEVDHLFDAFDNEVATTDSAPVRAITAVSSHTATRGGIETGRKQNNRMLTALIVTACVMAVGVFGLLVAGFVFGIF